MTAILIIFYYNDYYLTTHGSWIVGNALRPVFTGRKVRDDVKVQELKPPLVNHQCVVYKFKCDLCDADYEH